MSIGNFYINFEFLEITITKGLSKLYKSNYGKINQEIQKDIERWSTLTLDLSSRIQIIRMNVLTRVLYLFQSLTVEVPQSQFMSLNRIISRFVWGGKNPRIRLETLQLPKEEGGMGLPILKAYFHAAQLRYIVGWYKPDYTAKWKEMEKQLGEYPVQSIIGDEETYNVIKNQVNPITMFTLKLWFSIIKKHKIQKDTNSLKWVAYDSKFKPARYDKGLKLWTTKGITALCVSEGWTAGEFPKYKRQI